MINYISYRSNVLIDDKWERKDLWPKEVSIAGTACGHLGEYGDEVNGCFCYRSGGSATYLTTYKVCLKLESMPGLRTLDIVFSERFWREVGYGPRNQHPLKTAGLHVLRRMRGLDRVTFHGDCENVRADLEAVMMRPKQAEKTKKKKERKTEM